MIKFIKIRDPDNRFDQTDIEMSTDHVVLSDIITEFECFLQACGFIIDGRIAIVYEDEFNE